MDLRSIINTEAGESSIPKQAAPITPIQAPSNHVFREYSHPPQPSPGKHPSQDYTSQTSLPYSSPAPYQNPYPGRPPPPPPIQAPSQNDLRSPARSYSAQSSYQRTPSTSTSNSTQYPFPHNQTPQSPAQNQQYPSSFPHRDSYPQAHQPQHPSHHNSLSQANHTQNHNPPTPQTPPIGMPGTPHPFLQHQRSQSSLSASTPTPTSAQSQQPPYYNQYPQDSPLSAGLGPSFPPSQISHQRQQSQPGTPLGPPLTQRQSSGNYSHPQPSSPYQQRGISAGPFSHFQTSPAPPQSATIPSRHPSTPSTYDSQRNSLSEQRRSQSERERSLSVSPKTRVPSTPRVEVPTRISQQENGCSISITTTMKRKMDDREPHIDDNRAVHHQDIKAPINGDNRVSHSASNSPNPPPKKRIRYTEPPIWARSVRNKAALEIGQRAKVNGKQGESGGHPLAMARPETNGSQHSSPTASRAAIPDAPNDPTILLGPWETSLMKEPPTRGMTKAVADWLFQNVVSRDDIGELSSRGVVIEIEAKLGHLIDRATNQRYELPVLSECALRDNPNISFKSTMTLKQHQEVNKFLNGQVQQTHPQNPKGRPRVPITYLHRRETDKFYGLPTNMHHILPAAVRDHVRPHQGISVRVSTDQQSGQVLAKIMKTRIADINLYIPQYPLDCRISINFEMNFEGDIDEVIAAAAGERRPDRNKDRLSYSQGPYQIDLTQVTQELRAPNGTTRVEKEHELEIEVSTASIREQGLKAQRNEPNEYPTVVEGLLNNVILLSFQSLEKPPQR